MTVATTYPFDDSANYDFTASEIEVVGGEALLKSNTYADEVFYAALSTNKDADRSTGSSTGTLVGTAAISGGFLNCKGGTIAYVTYAGANALGVSNRGAMRVIYKPNYSGIPATARGIFILESTGGLIINEIQLNHAADGGLRYHFGNSSGGVIGSGLFGGVWSPTAGVEYELELNFDLTTNNNTELFVDGVSFGTKALSGTRGDTVDLIIVGATVSLTSPSDGEFRNFQLFDDVQHTAGYTPVVGGYPTYNAGTFLIEPNSANSIATTAMTSLSEVSTKPTGSDVKYALKLDGVAKYHDGANWVNSTSSSETNTIAEINADVGTLDMSAQVVLIIMMYLTSSDGSAAPQLSSNTVIHDFAVPPGEVGTCQVRAELLDASSNPIAGAKIKYVPNKFWYDEKYIFEEVEVTTDAEGKATTTVVETATKSATMNIRLEYQDGTVILYKNKIIPNQANESLSNIILT